MSTYYARSVEVAGTSFRLSDVNAFLGNTSNYTLHLEPEPGNEYDSNAVKVLATSADGTRRHIGYVPAHLASRIVRDIGHCLEKAFFPLMYYKASFKRPVITFDIIVPEIEQAAKAERTPE
jgi:hypothetical protein